MIETPDGYELTKTWIKRFQATVRDLESQISDLHTGQLPHDHHTEMMLQLQRDACQSMVDDLREQAREYALRKLTEEAQEQGRYD